MTKRAGTKLSDVPWNKLYIGMPVLSATGVPGKIVDLLDKKRDRFPSIAIDWENGNGSRVFHIQADKVICL